MTFIKDLPLLENIQGTDEIIIERVEGSVRTTGRMGVEEVFGFLIRPPVIDTIIQGGTDVVIAMPFLEIRCFDYTKVTIDGVPFPSVNSLSGFNQTVDITGLPPGNHTFIISNAYKTDTADLITV